jgi:hypothetical protein
VPCCWWRTLESRTLASRRWAERAATRIAALANCAKEADLPSVDLCLRCRTLLRPLHLDDEDRVTLAVLPSFRDDDDVVNWVVALEDGCSACTLPLDAHNLRCTPKKLVLGAYLLLLHLLRDVIVGDGAMARGGVAIFQYGLQDLLGEADGVDGVLLRDGLSVHGNAHVVVGIAEHTVDVKHHVSEVLLALGVVGQEELVRGVDGKVLRRLGGGGTHCSDIIIALPLHLLLGAGGLPWRCLELGRHGGVVVVVVGSVVGGGGFGVVGGSVVLVALFAVNLFVWNTGVTAKARRVKGRALE